MTAENLRIGFIATAKAHWLGNAAAVAGGWIICDETGSDLTAALAPHQDVCLAALPESMDDIPLRPVDPTTLVARLDAWIERDRTRSYCALTRDEDVRRQTAWRRRIAAMIS